jgi:hypothetical protein
MENTQRVGKAGMKNGQPVVALVIGKHRIVLLDLYAEKNAGQEAENHGCINEQL